MKYKPYRGKYFFPYIDNVINGGKVTKNFRN